jgi:hypothetical protein
VIFAAFVAVSLNHSGSVAEPNHDPDQTQDFGERPTSLALQLVALEGLLTQAADALLLSVNFYTSWMMIHCLVSLTVAGHRENTRVGHHYLVPSSDVNFWHLLTSYR